MSDNPFILKDVITPEAAGLAIAIFIIGMILNAGWKARNRVFIEKFIDHTKGESTPDPKITGLSTILVIELQRLRDLYEDVDERRSISSLGGRKGLLDYAIRVDDTAEILEGALTSDTSVSLGPFKVPVGVIAGVLGRVVQGPRISGSYHSDGDLHILTAQLIGKTAKSWRIEGKIASDSELLASACALNRSIPHCPDGKVMLVRENETTIYNIDAMTRELASRMFTDLTVGGSKSWSATHAFNEGIQEYRKTIYSSKDWLNNLKNAERRFLEAISDDNYFDLAWFNLGVVYTELNKRIKNREPAQKAFLNALARNPGRWQTYFSLALNRFAMGTDAHWSTKGTDSRRYDLELIEDVIHYLNQAITLSRNNAKLHDLLGVCNRIQAIQLQQPEREDYFIKAARNHAFAANKAWQTISTDEFNIGESNPGVADDNDKTAWISLWDQARSIYIPALCDDRNPTDNKFLDSKSVHDSSPRSRTLFSRFSFWTARQILRQARTVNPSNAIVECEMGKIFYEGRMFENAFKSFEAASRIEPSNLKYWFLLILAGINSQKKGQNQMDMALSKVMNKPSELYAKLSPRWKEVARNDLPKAGDSGRRLLEIFDLCEIEEKYNYQNLSNSEFNLKDLEIQYESAETEREKVTAAYNIAEWANNSAILQDEEKYEKEMKIIALEWYKKAFSSCNDHETWEKGIILHNLANCYSKYRDIENVDISDYENIDDLYDDAINLLFEKHEGEISRRRIFNDFVTYLLEKREINKAINTANYAYSRTPLGFNELAAMGECLLLKKDFVKAQESFEGALLLKPYDSEMHLNIGLCHWNMGEYSETLDEKNNYRKSSISYLERVREILDESDIKNKFLFSYHIGSRYFDLARYEKALYYLEIANAMSNNKEQLLMIRMIEALSLLYKRDHDNSESLFSNIIEEIERRIPDNKKKKSGDTGNQDEKATNKENKKLEKYFSIVINPFGEVNLLGHIYIRALLGKAYSLAERDAGIDPENNEAEDLSIRAEKAYEIIKHKHPDRSIESKIADRKGWIYYKQEKLKDAEKYVKHAISLKADPEYHLHLAYIYSSMIADSKEPEEQNLLKRKAVAQCVHVVDMATSQDMKERAEKMRNTIQPISPALAV